MMLDAAMFGKILRSPFKNHQKSLIREVTLLAVWPGISEQALELPTKRDLKRDLKVISSRVLVGGVASWTPGWCWEIFKVVILIGPSCIAIVWGPYLGNKNDASIFKELLEINLWDKFEAGDTFVGDRDF
ncbi:hypothetical protein WH47_01682 [Habropoda laboriosa]|uniref:Uncharacterized protein n=1 Tax=Habropoda laboriosa TaxID=597456 RepID=A0A0L7QZR4_9HYME|nr:hypothetical protein WH47_01682 [Habropoda laboriosa]